MFLLKVDGALILPHETIIKNSCPIPTIRLGKAKKIITNNYSKIHGSSKTYFKKRSN